MEYSQHALDRMAERGITTGNVEWCLAANNFEYRDGGRRYRRRVGRDVVMFVITNEDGTRIVSAWIRYY